MQDYGTYQYGRLTYRTAEEARAVADDLGLAGVHKHRVDGELLWMPGQNMERLNQKLQRRGLQPVTPPGQRGGDLFDIGLGSGGGGGLL